MEKATPYEHLRRVSTGYMRSSILGAAAELDCFTTILIHENQCSAWLVAKKLEADPWGVEVLLDALTATGFLSKKGSGAQAMYSVPDEYHFLLDSRHPETCIPMLRHMAGGQRTWSRLTWTVKDGKPQERQTSILGAEEDRVSFILGMNSVAMPLVGPTTASLKEAGILSFSEPNPRILDVGGASGTYARAMLEAHPHASVTIFDLPLAIGQARKKFTGSDLEKRIDFVEGDFMEEALPKGYDLAWLSAIIHAFGREECVHIYKNIHNALNPGATLAIRDYFMDADRTSPPDGALFAINMIVNTATGRVYTFDEARLDLEQAGFRDIRLAVPSPSMSAVVTARKE